MRRIRFSGATQTCDEFTFKCDNAPALPSWVAKTMVTNAVELRGKRSAIRSAVVIGCLLAAASCSKKVAEKAPVPVAKPAERKPPPRQPPAIDPEAPAEVKAVPA